MREIVPTLHNGAARHFPAISRSEHENLMKRNCWHRGRFQQKFSSKYQTNTSIRSNAMSIISKKICIYITLFSMCLYDSKFCLFRDTKI